jgi:hypothetical protein
MPALSQRRRVAEVVAPGRMPALPAVYLDRKEDWRMNSKALDRTKLSQIRTVNDMTLQQELEWMVRRKVNVALGGHADIAVQAIRSVFARRRKISRARR